jgi:hypothetical protein
LQEWQEAAQDETNRYKARQLLLGQKGFHLPYQNYTRDVAHRNWTAKPQLRHDPNMMDVDTAELQGARTYPSPQLRKERRHRGQCMQYGKTGHIMKNCPHGQPSKWNRNPGNTSYPIGQPCPNQSRSWAPQQNHMPPQPNKPPQYTQKRKVPPYREGYRAAYNIVDDRSPAIMPTQVHPTTNPGEAEQVLEGMTQDQPMCWRDINQQDF